MTGVGVARLWPDAAALLHRLDEDGRPLGESAAGIEVRHVVCPYSDGRAGLPMNADALEQVRGSFRSVLRLMSSAAAQHPPTVNGAWHTLSHCLALAAHSPAPIPRAHAALWKTSLGYHQSLALLILERDLGGLPLAELGNGAQFAAWCARERLLHGQHEVCGGPPGWIARGFEALLHPDPSADFPLDAATGDAFIGRVVSDLAARQQAHLDGRALGIGCMSWQVDGRNFSVEAVWRLSKTRC